MFCHIVVSETDIFPFPSSSSCTSVLGLGEQTSQETPKRLPACVPAPTALHLKRAVFKPTDPDSYFMSSSSFVTPSLLHMNREFLSKCEPENMNVDAVECLPMLTATSVPAGSYVTKVFEWVVLFLPDVTD